MRLLQLHDETWDSGIAHYALTLSEELVRRGHEVHFWAAPRSFAAERAREAGLALREIKRPWLSLPGLRREAGKLGIELINAHTGSSHTLAAALALGSGIGVVRTRADCRPPAANALARGLAGRTRAFIAANSRLREQLARAYPAARVELVLQGIASPAGAPPALPEDLVVGILGRLDPIKGHEDLLAAAAILARRLPNVKFLAAGGGREEQLSRLKSRAESLGLAGSFEFLGRVPDAFAFLARCRLGVVASTGSEAVSRAALEWMAAGRALVATNVGCLPDLVEDGKTGLLIAPGDPGALARALETVLMDSPLAARFGARARESFERHFNLERFAEQTEKIYENSLRHLPS